MFGLSDLVTKIIAGSLATALLAAGLYGWHEHSAAGFYQKHYLAQVQATSDANAKLSISNASIDTLQAALNEKNAESEQRARDYAAAKAADTATIAEMDRRQEADSSRIQTLLKLAKDLPDQPNCRVPAALAAQLEGL